MLFANRLGAAGVFSANRFADGINPNSKATFVIAGDELRFDFVFGDVERGRIRQGSLQAVANLREHLPVPDEHERYDAIASVFLSYTPGLRDALRVIRDVRLALHFWKYCDDHLIRGFALELRELIVEAFGRTLGNDARVIITDRRRFRWHDLGGSSVESDDCREADQEFLGPHRYQLDPAPPPPKLPPPPLKPLLPPEDQPPPELPDQPPINGPPNPE